MDKIYAISLLLAFILAMVSAFVTVPDLNAILLILGGIGALNTLNAPDLRLRIYAAAVVLILGAKSLADIPAVGDYLATIFSGVGTAFVGASVVGITLAIYGMTSSKLLK